jgi:KDO2-lipid IV(A) lauroyltransferase
MQMNLEFFFFQLFKNFVLLLPLKSAQRLGALLGLLGYYVMQTRRNIALENLQFAFPEKSQRQRKKIAKGAFKNYGITIVEMLWFPKLDESLLHHFVKIKNLDIMLERYKRGKGMVMLSGHFGNWELIALAVGYVSKLPITIIVQTQSNRLVDDVINHHRCLFGNRVVSMEKSPREILRVLSAGGVVAIAPDQSAARESIYVSFFGRKVSTHQGPAVFALRSGAAMQMGFIIRQKDGTYEIVLEEIFYNDLHSYSEENVIELTRRHTEVLERYIRMYPDHWLWMHRRWKHIAADTVEPSLSQSPIHA